MGLEGVAPKLQTFLGEMNEPSYTKKESYVLKLHELLWAFIARTDPNMTGDVVECAEEVLKGDGANETKTPE